MSARAALAPLLLVALGALAAVASTAPPARPPPSCSSGSGCVVAVSLLFWQVGRSEDEERRRR